MATQLFKNNITRSHAWAFNLCAAMFLTVAFSSGTINTQSRTVWVGVYQNEPKTFMDKNGRASSIFVKLLEQIIAQYDFHETLDRRLL